MFEKRKQRKAAELERLEKERHEARELTVATRQANLELRLVEKLVQEARSSETPISRLEMLSQLPDQWISFTALANPRTPLEVFLAAAESEDTQVRRLLSVSDRTTFDVLARLIEDENHFVRDAATEQLQFASVTAEQDALAREKMEELFVEAIVSAISPMNGEQYIRNNSFITVDVDGSISLRYRLRSDGSVQFLDQTLRVIETSGGIYRLESSGVEFGRGNPVADYAFDFTPLGDNPYFSSPAN